ILPLFYERDTILAEKDFYSRPIDESLVGQRIEKGMVPSNVEESFVGKRVTKELLAQLTKAGVKILTLKPESLIGRVFAKDVTDPETGEVLIEQGEAFVENHIKILKKYNSLQFDIIRYNEYELPQTLALTLAQDKCYSYDA